MDPRIKPGVPQTWCYDENGKRTIVDMARWPEFEAKGYTMDKPGTKKPEAPKPEVQPEPPSEPAKAEEAEPVADAVSSGEPDSLLPEGFDTWGKAELEDFVISNNLADGLDMRKSLDNLRSQVVALLAERNQ